MSLGKDVAIIVLPRDTLRDTGSALDRVRRMAPACPIVAVDIARAGSISAEARNDPRVQIVETSGFIRPFEARNLALARVPDAAFVIFVDTNTIPKEGCLSALAVAARETGKACVHPVVLFKQGEKLCVHAARCVLEPRPHGRFFPSIEHTRGQSTGIPTTRTADDYSEMHLVLFSRAALNVIAPFPELSLSEEVEAAMRMREARLAGSLLEPAARATYMAEPITDSLDRAYHRFRWNARSAATSIAKLRRWPIEETYWRDKQRWIRRRKRFTNPVFGLALRVKHTADRWLGRTALG